MSSPEPFRHLWKCVLKGKNPKSDFYLPEMIPETDSKAHGFQKAFLRNIASIGGPLTVNILLQTKNLYT